MGGGYVGGHSEEYKKTRKNYLETPPRLVELVPESHP